MDLSIIKNKIEELQYKGGIKGLAESIGMTEQNLHRCVRENKIQAQDLEKIAMELNISILCFFDERVAEITTRRLPIEEKLENLNKKIKKSRVIAGNNNQLNESGSHDNINGGEEAILYERIKSLEDKVADRDDRLREKDERIAQLRSQLADKERIIKLMESR